MRRLLACAALRRRCLAEDPNDRPSFARICEELQKLENDKLWLPMSQAAVAENARAAALLLQQQQE